jgi:hypothetical protein
MKRLFALSLAVALALSIAVPVSARGGNLPSTAVVNNGDGTITVSTTATTNHSPIQVRITGHQYDTIEVVWGYASDGGPTTITSDPLAWGCPCTASFWSLAGKWHQYSAQSDPFTP